MRISLVILFCCLCMVVVNSAAVKSTPRTVPLIPGRGTTKAPTKQSAYTYLRIVRGKKSCASGTCPFWERHGRSFVSLRCYAEQYKECVCLHRMCFSSCMFSREICNLEMVSCLKQICPRCMPVTQTAMCSVYDSMAQNVANALSVFACYPCCPNGGNTTTQSSNTITVTTTKPLNGSPTQSGTNTIAGQPGGTTTIGVNGINRPTNINSTPNPNTNRPPNGGSTVNNGRPSNGGNTVNNGRPSNGGNTVNNGRPSNGGNTGSNQGGNGVIFPGSGNLANAPVNGNVNNPSQSQRAKQTPRPTIRRTVTSRRTSGTTRRVATTTRRAAPVKSQKKPQSY